MVYDPHESAVWAVKTSEAAGEYLEGRSKVLADAGARGFPMVPGESLADLMAMGRKVKVKLVEGNGNLYEKERDRIYQLIEYNLKVDVAVQKLLEELDLRVYSAQP